MVEYQITSSVLLLSGFNMCPERVTVGFFCLFWVLSWGYVLLGFFICFGEAAFCGSQVASLS